VTEIWGSGPGGQWSPLKPAAYPAEAALHDLVQKAPQMLPLAGSPRLAVLGREVRLGTGSADLLAVESTGRLVVIEVKLAENAESRRAVVAQVLSYAGYLQGLDPEQLETQILGRHLEAGGSVLAACSPSPTRSTSTWSRWPSTTWPDRRCWCRSGSSRAVERADCPTPR
jgi:hypothetical protein